MSIESGGSPILESMEYSKLLYAGVGRTAAITTNILACDDYRRQ